MKCAFSLLHFNHFWEVTDYMTCVTKVIQFVQCESVATNYCFHK